MLVGKGKAAPIERHRSVDLEVCRWPWFGERRVPVAETDVGDERNEKIELDWRQLLGHRRTCGGCSHHTPRGVARGRLPSHHLRRGPQEVDVVGIVGEGIEALRLAGGDVALVL